VPKSVNFRIYFNTPDLIIFLKSEFLWKNVMLSYFSISKFPSAAILILSSATRKINLHLVTTATILALNSTELLARQI